MPATYVRSERKPTLPSSKSPFRIRFGPFEAEGVAVALLDLDAVAVALLVALAVAVALLVAVGEKEGLAEGLAPSCPTVISMPHISGTPNV